MTYATTDDVVTELGRSTSSSEETAQWQAWLDRVERIITRRFVRAGLVLADQVTDGNPTADEVADVEVTAVVRMIRNPDGLTSVTRTIDDGTITTRREGADDVSGLVITDAEWASLLPNFEAQAWSTRPGFEPDDPTVDLSWT